MPLTLIVVNKFWECDAVMAALLNETVRERTLGWPQSHHQPRVRGVGLAPMPRAVYERDASRVEIWCVSDFLEESAANLQSSTAEKARVLPALFAERPADMLVAVGTAGYPSTRVHANGSVTIGTDVFLHDGHPGGANPNSAWVGGSFDRVIASSVTPERFEGIIGFDRNAIAANFVKVPNDPAPPAVLADRSFVSLGTVNVTDYREFATKDGETVAAFEGATSGRTGASLETTHGLLRTLGPSEFLFVSAITDRLGSFDEDVTVGQNFAASFNAGIVLSALIPRF